MFSKNYEFNYTLYINATPKQIWEAITVPKLTKQFWGYENASDWKKGSKWQHFEANDKTTVRLEGSVIESMPPTLLVLSWEDPANLEDGSIVKIEIKPLGTMSCLNLTHNSFKDGHNTYRKIMLGWPKVLSSMKSFLETGKGLNIWDERN